LKRHASLVPLLRDHHHALAEARRLHIRFEERRLFPLLEEVAPEALARLDLAAPPSGSNAAPVKEKAP
jgi:hypothetical protein